VRIVDDGDVRREDALAELVLQESWCGARWRVPLIAPTK